MNQTEPSEPTEKSCAKNRARIRHEDEECSPLVFEEASMRPFAGLTQFTSIDRLEERGGRNLQLGSDREQMAVVWATSDGDPERMVYGLNAVFWKGLAKLGRSVVEVTFIAAMVIATLRIVSFVSTYVGVHPDVIKLLVGVPVGFVIGFFLHCIETKVGKLLG